jgi:hypothetical protein
MPPSHFLKKKNPKKKKEKKKSKNMLGWPNHPIGGGRPPHLAWGGSATPRPAGLGSVEPPPVAQGVVRPPLRPNAQKQNFERLAQGGPNHPLGHWGWFDCPQTARPRCGRTTPGQTGWSTTTYGVVRPPQHIFLIFSFFLFLFFKCDGGILGINRLNGLSCHNLKVWEGKVSHFKLWRQK